MCAVEMVHPALKQRFAHKALLTALASATAQQSQMNVTCVEATEVRAVRVTLTATGSVKGRPYWTSVVCAEALELLVLTTFALEVK